ncbi:MAG: GNAT family N-acetyltransferase [Saprospiraceae bacterium]
MFKTPAKHCGQGIGHLSNYQYCVYDKIDGLESVFTSLKVNDIFFDHAYLKTIHTLPPKGIKPYLITVSQDTEVVGIVVLQLTYTRLSENFRKSPFAEGTLIEKPISVAKNLILKSVNFNTVVCGNLMITGLHGYHFQDRIIEEDAFLLAQNAAEYFINHENLNSALVLFKDFDHTMNGNINEVASDFTIFQAQPDMKMLMKKGWNNIDDYKADLKSKYRVRFNKARSEIVPIQKRMLDLDDIQKYTKEISALYRQVSDKADFNTFILQDGYFTLLKQNLKDLLQITGYFLDDKLIGFHCAIINNHRLYAHFLGYDKSLNGTYQLYQNMLYDLVDTGIKFKSDVIDFSRTAIEIKSTVGAKAFDLHLFLKHTNCLVNMMVSPITALLKPEKDYVIRDPFK